MTEQIVESKRRLVIGCKRDGRNCYDSQAKRELSETCLQPGVSVAKLALKHGASANLLRIWVTKHQRQLSEGGSLLPSAATLAPFIPVVAVTAERSPITPAELAVRLPNSVRLEWSALPADQPAQVLRLLSTLPCSESIPGERSSCTGTRRMAARTSTDWRCWLNKGGA